MLIQYMKTILQSQGHVFPDENFESFKMHQLTILYHFEHTSRDILLSFLFQNLCKLFLPVRNLKLQQKYLHYIKSSLKCVYSREQLHNSYVIRHVSHFLLSCKYLHIILCIPSERLLTRFDNKLVINLVPSINFNM